MKIKMVWVKWLYLWVDKNWYELFLVSLQKMPKNALSWFFDLFLNFFKAIKNWDYSANFQNCCNFFFVMGPHYVDFAFAFDTTLIILVLMLINIIHKNMQITHTKQWKTCRGKRIFTFGYDEKRRNSNAL